jgi:hypothetical protein
MAAQCTFSRPSRHVTSTPQWTGQAGNALLQLMQLTNGIRTWYALHVVEDGRAEVVAVTADYPSALAAIQTWIPYLTNGGTVAAWLERYKHAELPDQPPRGPVVS